MSFRVPVLGRRFSALQQLLAMVQRLLKEWNELKKLTRKNII